MVLFTGILMHYLSRGLDKEYADAGSMGGFMGVDRPVVEDAVLRVFSLSSGL